jgi:hypothetical protein
MICLSVKNYFTIYGLLFMYTVLIYISVYIYTYIYIYGKRNYIYIKLRRFILICFPFARYINGSCCCPFVDEEANGSSRMQNGLNGLNGPSTVYPEAKGWHSVKATWKCIVRLRSHKRKNRYSFNIFRARVSL